jgi:Rps23 Pro-64 3,4-dihydroxylase Tpa1-like proline 4-hydroxylase
MLRPYDREQLKQQFNGQRPFRWFTIPNFLEDDFAREVVAAYPSFDQSRQQGFEFKTVNEQKKVQITDSARFPAPVKKLAEALSSPKWLEDLAYITNMPKLLADDKLEGGGMHITGAGGRLDVHVDFNYLEGRDLHRRLNILVYLNPDWQEAWGGNIELWDPEVKNRLQAFSPVLNRCVVFETNEISYHGVSPVTCPENVARRSFAAYYYTAEAPPGWKGQTHSTVFRARPEERLRGYVLMPLENAQRRVQQGVAQVKQGVKRLLGQ